MSNDIDSQIMQFKVTLKFISPPIWRRLLMPADATLGDLHYAIQRAMGWGNYHLHCFRSGKMEFGAADIEEVGWLDEESITVSELFVRPKMKVRYQYDFGDDWEHEIVFEKFVAPKPGELYPQCIAGKRACPPEDCGSYPGYERLCELMANPKLPDPHGIRRWVGGKFDPEKFDLLGANLAVMAKRSRAKRGDKPNA